MAKHTFTNVSDGPRVANSTTGPVTLAAGAVVEDVELSDAEAASAKATGWFEFAKAPAKPTRKDD